MNSSKDDSWSHDEQNGEDSTARSCVVLENE